MILPRLKIEEQRRRGSRIPGCRGFSIVELLVAVSILSLIILILYSIFDQTQLALRSNVAQVDVLESGRAAMDLLSRELQETASARRGDSLNLMARVQERPASPVLQLLSESDGETRTNVLMELFFLRRLAGIWTGTGYRVINAANGVGTLARFSTNRLSSQFVSNVTLSAFFNAPTNALQPIANGIVHLRVVAYDSQGNPFQVDDTRHAHIREFGTIDNRNVQQIWLNNASPDGPANVFLTEDRWGQTDARFASNALPAYLDVELGVLEPAALEQFRSFPTPNSARAFLRERAGQVHLFRQRIPIHTAAR